MGQESCLALDQLLSFEPAALADPYAIYRRLREAAPVHWHDSPGHSPAWHVTGYPEVAAALRDPRLSANSNYDGRGETALDQLPEPSRTQALALRACMGLFMQRQDPPGHTRLRGLVAQAFSPRAVEALRGRIQRLVDERLDAVAPRGRMDVITDFAYPVPADVIAALFGLPDDGRELLRGWSAAIADFFGGREGVAQGYRTIQEFAAYLGPIIAARRLAPGDDLVSALVAAEQAGDRLSEQELVANCLFLLFAGHETTTNLIGNGLLALLRHPEALATLRDDPALLAPAVEELLRYDSPAQYTFRVAMTDLDLGGQRIGRGEALYLWRGAANRDPAQFPDPDRLNVARRGNRHLSFAHGPHYCLGAALARLEGELALGTLLRRFPRLQLADAQIEWRDNLGLRGLKALPVVLA